MHCYCILAENTYYNYYTGIVFYLILLTNLIFATDGYRHYIALTGFRWLIIFAPLRISLYFGFGYDRINPNNAQILF